MVQRIGIINGSVRTSSNTAGVIRWLEPIIHSALKLPDSNSPSQDPEHSKPSCTDNTVEVEVIHLIDSPSHPLPLCIGNTIPAAISSPSAYPDPSVAVWSETVSAWDGLIIVSPQYNWGIPALLKNSLDHLYTEWRGKPVAIITLGGHGGGKCAEQLKIVCGGGLKMRVVESMCGITLPREFIQGERRVAGMGGGGEDWLGEYEAEVRKILGELRAVIQASQQEGKTGAA